MNPLVSNPMSQKFHQPFLVHIVKESFDIGLDNMVNRFLFNCHAQRLECIMTASVWTKSVRVSYKILLVDRLQYPDKS